MAKFSGDLEFGREAERFALSLYDYDDFELAPNKAFPYWDFNLTTANKKVYYEVKKDRVTKRTGNIAIEFECRNKPSGISITTADYYLYFIEGEQRYYEIPVAVLKKYIADKKFHTRWRGGDDGVSLMYLFRREVFADYEWEYEHTA
jgi:hypothetical protein